VVSRNGAGAAEGADLWRESGLSAFFEAGGRDEGTVPGEGAGVLPDAEQGREVELFRDRHNDWGRDLALWGGRLYGGLTLAELGREAGGLDYATVAVATARLVKKAKKDRVLRKAMATLKAKCEK